MTPEIIAEGKFLRFMRRGHWEYVERRNISGIVGIVAVTSESKLLLVEQFRPPLQKNVIELPAGLAGDITGSEEELLAEAARRELLEETGYAAERFELLTEGAASAGLCDEIIGLFKASGLKKVTDGGGDHSERITVHEIPLSEVHPWLEQRHQSGTVIDLKVYAGLCFLSE